MKENGELNRSGHEVHAIIATMKRGVPAQVRRAMAERSDKLLDDDLLVIREQFKRLVLLRVKEEDGIESMKFFEKRLEKDTFESEISDALKEVAATPTAAGSVVGTRTQWHLRRSSPISA